MLCDEFTYFSQVVGMTTTVPSKVPYSLPTEDDIGANNNEWYYDGNTLYHNHSSTHYSPLPSLHDFKVGDQVGLLLLPNGELHLIFDGKKSAKIATGLPVHKSLFGAVDVWGTCTKIKSEILSGQLDGVCLCTCTYIYNRHVDVHLSRMKRTLHYCYLGLHSW